MLKSVSVKLYPTNTQKQVLACSFGCCRKVYNLALDKSIAEYKENGKSITSLYDFTKLLFHDFLKDEELQYLHKENTKILAGSLNNLSFSFQNFFNNLKKDKGNKKGFPKFKAKDKRQTLNLVKLAFSKKVLDIPNRLFISKKYGFIRYMTSNENIRYIAKYKENIKNITIVKLPSEEYYARILIDGNLEKTVKPSNSSIGIDLGVKDFVITSEAQVFPNPHFHRNAEKKLIKLQRDLSNKKKGSTNRNKSRIKLAKYSQHITNCKKNYMHVVSNILINENQVICMENLNVSGMLKNHKLAKAIQEINFGEFRQIMEYKCQWYGRNLVFVGRTFPSSKRCNHCGHIKENLTLKDRTWECDECHSINDRDINAARNILEEGLRILNQ